MQHIDIGWVDIACLALLGLSIVIGFSRGLVFEVLSLAGWIVAYVAAQAFAPSVAPYMPFGSSLTDSFTGALSGMGTGVGKSSSLNHGLAFACTFLVVLVVWSLATRLVSLLVRATPLSIIDRVLGAGFGAVRAVVLLLVIATVLAMSPSLRWPAWRASRAAVWSSEWLRDLKPVLPDAAARQLDA
jgi:membrane protein required for colicin V production